MADKIIVEFSRKELEKGCYVLGGRYCEKCKKADYDLASCNIKTTDFKIREQKKEIKPKFKVGDKVWTIHQINGYVKCPKCRGKSKVLVGNIDYYCKECYGTGKVFSQEVKWRVSENFYTITQIRVFIDKGGIDVAYFDENLITSEFLGKEKDCFATKEKAEIECRRRNNEI